MFLSVEDQRLYGNYIKTINQLEDKQAEREAQNIDVLLDEMLNIGVAVGITFLDFSEEKTKLKGGVSKRDMAIAIERKLTSFVKRPSVEADLKRSLRAVSTGTIDVALRDIPTPDGEPLKKISFKQRQQIINKRLKILQRSIPKTSSTRITNGILREIGTRKGGIAPKNSVIKVIQRALSKATIARARLIAITETTAITNNIVNVSIENAGYKRKQWITENDRKVRTPHRVLHKKHKPLKEVFLVKYRKQTLRLQYPQEPNCRCRIVPYIPQKK